ncbi:MAG TPA: lysylphosphatidylglycerol synthase transmembrane domain-containing protein [Longimicrobiales bacterium]
MSGSRKNGVLGWKSLLGVALSAALLAFALRGVHLGEVLREVSQARPLEFLAAVTAATLVFLVRAWRWRPLLQPMLPDAPLRPRFAATTIGFMTNNILPVRIGEFARAFALSRMQPIPVAASFGTVAVERLFDGLTIIVFLLIAMALPSFPGTVSMDGVEMGGLLRLFAAPFAAAGLLLLAMVVRPRWTVMLFERSLVRLLPRRLRRPVVDALEAFLAGLVSLRTPSLVLRTALWSVVLWLLNALSFWLAFLAFDIPVGFGGALFLQSLIAILVAVPSAPGFFGPYEFAVRFGLVGVWGVEVNKALGFAIGFHMGSFIPVTVIGLYYAWRLGLSLREVERSEDLVEAAVARDLAGAGPVGAADGPGGDQDGSPQSGGAARP